MSGDEGLGRYVDCMQHVADRFGVSLAAVRTWRDDRACQYLQVPPFDMVNIGLWASSTAHHLLGYDETRKLGEIEEEVEHRLATDTVAGADKGFWVAASALGIGNCDDIRQWIVREEQLWSLIHQETRASNDNQPQLPTTIPNPKECAHHILDALYRAREHGPLKVHEIYERMRWKPKANTEFILPLLYMLEIGAVSEYGQHFEITRMGMAVYRLKLFCSEDNHADPKHS